MTSEQWITTLEATKYLSIATSALFGVMGAAFETKEANGRLNTWGRIAIAGVILSGVCGSMVQALESRVKREEAKEATRQSNEATDRQVKALGQLNSLIESSRDALARLEASRAEQSRIATLTDQNLRLGVRTQALSAGTAQDLQKSLSGQREVAGQLQKVVEKQDGAATNLEALVATGSSAADRLERLSSNAQEQVLASERILRDVRRGLNPLRDVRASFVVALAPDEPEMQRYVERIKKGLDALIPKWQKDPYWSDGMTQPTMTSAGKLIEVFITNRSSLYPDDRAESLIRSAVQTVARLQLYRHPIEIIEFPAFEPVTATDKARSKTARPVPPDLEIEFDDGVDVSRRPSHSVLFRPPGSVAFEAQVGSDERRWQRSEDFISTDDLAGAQAFIMLDTFGQETSDGRIRRIPTRLREFALRVADRRTLSLPVSEFRLHPTEQGEVIYEYRFPSDPKQFARLLN